MLLNVLDKTIKNQSVDFIGQEIFVKGTVISWKPNHDSAVRTFTFREPVLQAVSCQFADQVLTPNSTNSRTPRCLCVLQHVVAGNDVLELYSEFGEDFSVPLPFKVRRMFAMIEGLMIERATEADIARVPAMGADVSRTSRFFTFSSVCTSRCFSVLVEVHSNLLGLDH